MSRYEFTFPIMVDGGIAAEIDARCSFTAKREEGVTHIDEIEIEVIDGIFGPRRWANAPEWLAKIATDWLWANIAKCEDAMLDDWEEDQAGAEADYRYEQMRADQMERGAK